MNGKLPVAIIWHMHQPYYRHPQTSEFVLPWVRLHASKDYLHMARLLQEFPKVKANFTMVPSLRDQLEDYARGADDEDTRLTMRTVDGDLTYDEKQHMLRRFFSIHHGNVIHRHDEYRRLLQLASAAHGLWRATPVPPARARRSARAADRAVLPPDPAAAHRQPERARRRPERR